MLNSLLFREITKLFLIILVIATVTCFEFRCGYSKEIIGPDHFTVIKTYNLTSMEINELVFFRSPNILVAEKGKYTGKTLDELMILLSTLPGWFDEYSIFGFTGDKTLFEAIGRYGHEAVKRLVDCMDNMSPAGATITEAGPPVPIGLMCYRALISIAYYEHEVEEDWKGTIMSVTPTGEGLRAAKQAWKEVVQKQLYHLL